MIKSILTIAVFLFLAGYCGTPAMNGNRTPMEKIMSVYRGMLPCADCAGINTELTLNADQTFTLKETYLTGSPTLAAT